MITRGEYVTNKKAYGVILNHTKQCSEAVLVENNTVVSAYKIDITGRYSYNNTKAKDLVELALDGVKGCNTKNGQALPWEKGTLMEHMFTKKKVEYTVQLYRNEIIGMYATKGEDTVRLERAINVAIPQNIPYIQLTDVKKGLELSENELDAIPTRSVEEIALEKEDVSWLKKKKYYIVNDDEDAERLFTFLDNYNGVISYDTETTGLKINCFGKIGSSYMADLERHNAEHPDDKVRADRLVGIIFCVEPDVSYYFPCFNRKFKNLYEDKNSTVRKKIIQNIRARYTVGAGVNQNHIGDMLRYIQNTPDDEIRLDVILMERVRHILETKHIATHHGSFEWKVGWQYEIDTNLKDDSMLMHQLMYKFRSTTANSGEPSNLKYLTKVELGIDQWELKDFFPNWKEDKKGTVRERKDAKSKGTQIDFSYMDYEGSRVYAPADGDFTLQLVLKYKEDMIKNHSEMLYIYDVEMLVSCAIGYMEFYGHRLNESKILGAREDTRANILMIEHEIRSSIGYNGQAEDDLYNQLVNIKEQIKNEKDHNTVDNVLVPQMTSLCEKMRAAIDADEAHAINLSAPGQVADLFYNKLGYPMPSDKMSVAKKELKALVKERDSDGNLKYPVASLYSKYKNETTLMTKFFDNLPYFMYPGGFIFSSYGQIATATGRMSCIEENAEIAVVGGNKPIKDVKVGDPVYCYDDAGQLKIKKVLNVIDKGIRECIKLNWVSQGSHKEGSLICTPDHRIKTKDRGWVEAQDLEINDRVYHLSKSCEDRPRLYGANGFVQQEQLFIKGEYFGKTGHDTLIHHKDADSRNNSIDNFEIMTRDEHSRNHAIDLVNSGRIKTDHLVGYSESVPKGEDHPKYIKKTAEELESMLVEAKGVLTKVGMDFDTFKRKCDEVGFDYKAVIGKMRSQYKDIDPEDFVASYFNNGGVVYAIARDLGIDRVRVENMINEMGLNTYKEYQFSDNEYIEAFFKLQGDNAKLRCAFNITDKDIRDLNKRLNLVYNGIDDELFIKVFMENKGSIRAVARELGITFYKAYATAKRLNVCYHHSITSIETVGERHVYDLEVEDCHNFIANEICVHNCNKPNAQQYPKVITKIVVPREDFVMVDADYSQIEYRVLTALAKNEGLAELFADPDSDYHTLMASLMYDVPYASVTPQMRSAAKSFNFGIPYGMGFGSLAILLTGKKTKQTIEEAKEKYEMYFKNQPKTRAFFADIKEMAQVHKYTKTLFNRYRYYTFTDKDGNINEGRKAAALRQAGNAVIQGCERGDTLIQTKEFGIVKVEDVVNTHLHVWNGTDWTEGDILYSGKKQKCIITFSNGQKFVCSPIHKFLVRSHKGNERFVECKDLATKQNSKNPHRIVINKKFVNSDWRYSSNEARAKYTSNSCNAKNVFLDDIGDSFKIGVVLGRLASDGNTIDTENHHAIRQIIAEHEFDVGKTLADYMKPLGLSYYDVGAREGRTEDIIQLKAHSKSLVKEVVDLDIKNKIHDKIFMDTEMLRGFLRGIFDGDGGVSGKTITLTFGTQADFEPMCRQIQKALLFFGIRSRYYKYDYRSKITIKTNDNERFMKLIGFINKEKNEKGNSLECVNDEHLFGRVLIPESVEITDEYIDMYDVCNTDCGYYVADGIITHNTAADIFKISVARNFNWIRRNKLFGLVLIINMVHDEQLMEINSKYLNVTKALADIGVNMQFKIDGFPPLFIGAGCGPAWGYAKGKMAEIHPTLLQNIIDSNRTTQLFKSEPKATVEEDQKKIADMVYEFRRSKVANYLSNPENWHKAIHPAIGGLINLQFNYGRGDDAKAYIGPNGETYSDSEFLELNIADFLKENGINADPKWFSADEMLDEREEEEEEGYDDNEDDEFNPDDMGGELADEVASIYKKIEEDSSLYGSDISDLVKTFGCVALPGKKIIGFDVRDMNWRNRDALVDWLEPYTFDDDEESLDGAMEIAFFKEGNIFNKTGIYVKGIEPSEAEKQYKIIKNTKKFASVIDYKAGDIHNRSQAK